MRELPRTTPTKVSGIGASKPPPPPARFRSETNEDVGYKVLIGSGVGLGIALLILMLLLLFWLFGRDHRPGDGADSGPIAAGSGGGLGGGDGNGHGSGIGDGNGPSELEPGATEVSNESGKADSPTDTNSGALRESTDQGANDSSEEALPEPNYSINVLPSQSPAPPVDGDTPGASGGGGGSGGIEFFGVKSKGNKFVYIVDCSGSMSGAPFSKACQELLDSIHRLRSSQSVYVFFFDSREFPMYYPQPAEDKLLRATKKNLETIDSWVRQFRGGGGTDPRQALLQALELKPDAIFLLTDGGFDPSVVNEVTHSNQKKVIINTIGFINSTGEVLLKKLAEENRGKYRFVP